MPTSFQSSLPPAAHALRRTPAARWLTGCATWLIACATFVLTCFVPAQPAHAASGLADLPAILPVMACEALVTYDFRNVTDGRVTIKSATVSTTGSATPYCAVTATIAPADTFVMRLPTQGWTQRYVQTGCGGECGSSNIGYTEASTCTIVVDGSVASATTDMGHQGQGSPSGAWAANNPQAQIDFAYRGMHDTAQVAKALITKFYGRRPVYSYFDGCSDGGREALMEAQRYPLDFDGIVAGAPASDVVTQNTYHHGWNVLANQDANGSFILLAAKLPMLHAAVLAACDALDGATDGLIDDPRNCHFNPSTLVCNAGQDPATCLTAPEAGVVQRLHDGAVDSAGNHLDHKIAHEWGSELDWSLFVPTAATGVTPQSANFVTSWFRYLGYFNVANPNLQVSDVRMDLATFNQIEQPSVYLSADDPDLTAFKQHGGKLLLWHGWADQHITPQGTLEYYDAMQTTMGRTSVNEFAKLYLFPGVAHCGGGEGPDTFDVLTPVMAWVESGITPGSIVASKVVSGTVTRTRPVFPYPTVARYTGSGNLNDAASFVAYTPANTVPGPDADYDWAGKKLYSHGYQAACLPSGTQLACNPMSLPFTLGY